jgi:hypothetical protein
VFVLKKNILVNKHKNQGKILNTKEWQVLIYFVLGARRGFFQSRK